VLTSYLAIPLKASLVSTGETEEDPTVTHMFKVMFVKMVVPTVFYQDWSIWVLPEPTMGITTSSPKAQMD